MMLVSRRALAAHAEFDHAVPGFIFLHRRIFKSHRLLLSTASIITLPQLYLDRWSWFHWILHLIMASLLLVGLTPTCYAFIRVRILL